MVTYCSRMVGQRAYLVSRMDTEEREAFAQFLSRSGFVARAY